MTAPTVCSDFGAQENKIYHFFSSIYHEVMGPDMMILVCVFLFVCFLFFWMLSFKPAFHSLLSPSSKGSLVSVHFWPLECIICISMESEMETQSSIFAWKILQTEEPGGLQAMELQRVRYNWATEHICISEVVDIFSINLDSSLCFIQPGISHYVDCT